MKKKVIIFGTSIFSQVVFQTIVQEDLAEVVAFTLNNNYIDKTEFEGIPVIPFEERIDRPDRGS